MGPSWSRPATYIRSSSAACTVRSSTRRRSASAPLDPPHEPGHAHHDQDEQHRPGTGDGADLELAALEALDDQ